VRLVQINNETLINPEHVSHIAVRKEVNPTAGMENDHGHDYPIYRITMYDGKWFDIAFKHDYIQPNDPHAFLPLQYILQDITTGYRR
jgi:hypothetical protein